MSNLQIKNVPAGLHEELRRRAERSGLTVRDYLLRLIEADQRLPSREEWLEEVRAHSPVSVTADDVVRAVAEGREEREDTVLGGVTSVDPG